MLVFRRDIHKCIELLLHIDKETLFHTREGGELDIYHGHQEVGID